MGLISCIPVLRTTACVLRMRVHPESQVCIVYHHAAADLAREGSAAGVAEQTLDEALYITGL